jgi:glycosyltransferase involved in cell wall biosynthesis
MNTPGVSVVIPTYNCGKYIAESIGSALAQTRPPAEILIIDDGSTDGTRAVVSTRTDPRIRYIEVPHKGTAAARNRGIDLASGEYLAFLDADDRWRPTMLEKQVAVMEHDRDLICSFTNFVRFVEGTGEICPEQFEFYPELATLPVEESASGGARIVQGDAFVHFIGFEEIPAYMQCMLFRRSMIAGMRLNEALRRCQDLEFVARVFMRGKVAFTREVLTEVRRHDSNATRDISLMALDKLWALLPLQHAVDTPARHAALNDRLVKAWIDAATTLIRTGSRLEGLRHYMRALAHPGSGIRKLKGTARIGGELVTSLGG